MNSTLERAWEQSKGPNAAELLASCRIEVAPETFSLVSLDHAAFADVLRDAGISPRGAAPFFILSDKYEVTLMLAEQDLRLAQHSFGKAKIESGFRLVTFDVVLDFGVTGFLAKVAELLADAGVPIIAVSAFSRDHLLVKQDDLRTALTALGSVNQDLC